MADAAAFGIEVSDEYLPSTDFEVLQCNWPAVSVFARCSTQWRTGMSGVYGLDYLAVKWVFRLYAIDDPVDVLEAIQVMESEVVKRLAAKN